MNLQLFDLRPIKEVGPQEKANLPVSFAISPDGSLSVVSRYGDMIWDFYPYILQENRPPSSKCIDWRIHIKDDRKLTDPEYENLLESAKDFIWSLFTHPIEGRKRPTFTTLCNKVTHLVPLLRWLARLGIQRFEHLAGRTLDYVEFARLNNDGRKAVNDVVKLRLAIIEDLYRQRDLLNDCLTVPPWPHETAGSLSGYCGHYAGRKPSTAFIPDAIAEKIAAAAIGMVQNRAEKILEAQRAAELAAASKSGAWSQSMARIETARIYGYSGSLALTKECLRLRTACYIVIDMFSGIRDSEMKSLAENCISQGKSADGSTDVLWLHGTIYKTGLRPKKWLVPSIVNEAIGVLTRLTASLRQELRDEEADLIGRIDVSIGKERTRLVKRLSIVRRLNDKLFLGRSLRAGGVVFVIGGNAIRRDLTQFCADHGIQGEDGGPYHLHPHQFRRTYARFIARSELGDLLTLRDHFGHWSIDMTVCYVDGAADEYESDTELLELVTTEKTNRRNEIMKDYLDSDDPLANGGRWLNSWRSSVRTAANKEALIAEYASTITLNGTGHSWCVGNAKGNGCGGLCIFEAQKCVDCNFGIIGQEHRPVWEGIRDQQKEVLNLDDIGVVGRARAHDILAYAETVLLRLGDQEVRK